VNIFLYGLSRNSIQIQKLHNYIASIKQFTSCYVRNINNLTIDEFKSKLNIESLEGIFEGFDTNITFRNFLNIH
jgi:hypothetical protein